MNVAVRTWGFQKTKEKYFPGFILGNRNENIISKWQRIESGFEK